MLVGYVSNERFVALGDVLFEFRGRNGVIATRSNISGAVYADLEPGHYEVVLGRDGYGTKIVSIELKDGEPQQFRLL
ncbi:MAG: carboxypeptidase regulatory-like domain-containing protein, partial [Fuerstiella sp.]|nr:carboxypeptidase regulatory-like domain-containing protein [Fuerstiella sp.]